MTRSLPRRVPLRTLGPRFVGEIAIVVIGVLLALGVNEWRQQRSNQQLAAQIHQVLRNEVQSNQRSVQRAAEQRALVLGEWRQGGNILVRVPLIDSDASRVHEPDHLDTLLQSHALQLHPGAQVRVLGAIPGQDHAYYLEIDGVAQNTVSAQAYIESDQIVIRSYGGLSLSPATVVDSAWGTMQATGAAVLLNFELVDRVARMHQAQRHYEALSRQATQFVYAGNLFGASMGFQAQGFIYTLKDLHHSENDLLTLYEQVLEKLPPKPSP